MEPNTPLVSGAEYEGLYVVLESGSSDKIIASGTDPGELIREARERGIAVPAIVYVPKRDVIYVY